MPTSTPRLGLTKPLTSESYDVGVHNGNMDLLDAAPANVTVCTSTTRPSAPDNGDVIYETDTENLLLRNSGAWVSFNAKMFICTASTRPTSTKTYGGFCIFETDTGNRQIRNAANTAWIPFSPYRVASQAERDALTLLPNGFLVWRADLRYFEVLDAGSWVAYPRTGMVRVVATRIAANAGVTTAAVGATETNIARIQVENINADAGWYTVGVKISMQATAAASSYMIRVRKDTTSGFLLHDSPMLPIVAGFTQEYYFEFDFILVSADADLDLYCTLQRVAGSGTCDVNGNERTFMELRHLVNPADIQKVT